MPQAVDLINTNDVGSVRPVSGCTSGSTEPVLAYVKPMGENKQVVVLPRVLPVAAVAAAAASLCGHDDDKNISDKEQNGLKIIKKMKKKKKNKGGSSSARPRLLGILKAVLFETSLAKRIRKRKIKQKTCQTSSGSSNEESSMLKEFDQDGSITSSASACTSSSDPTNKSLRLKCKQKQQRDVVVAEAQHHHHLNQHGRGCYDSYVGFCLILISLLILIVWGKLCAIFCTSTWLFLGARWNTGNQSSENMPVDSKSSWEDW
ncbi:uncharacterized protein LOC18054329 [Citrus clementina]|uniref:uncharacterized protein LOC18054329 n=1 Tax=Citrus clementina TaxID=85681 RepID=UPI000CED7EB6|nr:uncharacterized protein LOC18054329 [Citrus x clementina]